MTLKDFDSSRGAERSFSDDGQGLDDLLLLRMLRCL
jgi:hypothetical protein